MLNAKRVRRELGSNVRSEGIVHWSRSLYRLSHGGTVPKKVSIWVYKSHAISFILPLILYSSLNTIDLEAVRRLKLWTCGLHPWVRWHRPYEAALKLICAISSLSFKARRLKVSMQPRLMNALVLGHVRPASTASEAVSWYVLLVASISKLGGWNFACSLDSWLR